MSRTKLKKQLIITEDDSDYATGLAEDIQKETPIDEIKITANKDEVEEIFSSNSVVRAFIVDLELKIKGKKTIQEGLQVIKTIRKYEPRAKIIAHSGHSNQEAKALEAGADDFVEKGNYQHNLKEFKDLIEASWVQSKQDQWKRIESIPCIITNHNDDFVFVDCLIDSQKKTVEEKTYPRILFEGIGGIKVNRIVEIQVYQKKGAIKYQISENSTHNFRNFYNFDDPDSSKLYGSPIFEPE
ncbi:MAG: response regulator [Bacteroidota bacterium]